jgi:hypothetical protein
MLSRVEARARGDPLLGGVASFEGVVAETVDSVLAGDGDDAALVSLGVSGDGGRLVSIGVIVRTIGWRTTARWRRWALVMRSKSFSVTPCALSDSSHWEGRPSSSGVTCSSC